MVLSRVTRFGTLDAMILLAVDEVNLPDRDAVHLPGQFLVLGVDVVALPDSGVMPLPGVVLVLGVDVVVEGRRSG